MPGSWRQSKVGHKVPKDNLVKRSNKVKKVNTINKVNKVNKVNNVKKVKKVKIVLPGRRGQSKVGHKITKVVRYS